MTRIEKFRPVKNNIAPENQPKSDSNFGDNLLRPKLIPENTEEMLDVLSSKHGVVYSNFRRTTEYIDDDHGDDIGNDKSLTENSELSAHLHRRDIGKLVAHIRKQKGLTQSQLAAAIGISQPSVGRFETGKRDPSLETIAQYETVLGGKFRIVFEPD